jgi:TfoX/Sxy family transcriptional regulator of competence genes
MKSTHEFADYAIDLFPIFGRVARRRMFGGMACTATARSSL